MQYVSRPQLCKMIGRCQNTLCAWSKAGVGPKGFKARGRWYYALDDVIAWIEQVGGERDASPEELEAAYQRSKERDGK